MSQATGTNHSVIYLKLCLKKTCQELIIGPIGGGRKLIIPLEGYGSTKEIIIQEDENLTLAILIGMLISCVLFLLYGHSANKGDDETIMNGFDAKRIVGYGMGVIQLAIIMIYIHLLAQGADYTWLVQSNMYGVLAVIFTFGLIALYREGMKLVMPGDELEENDNQKKWQR